MEVKKLTTCAGTSANTLRDRASGGAWRRHKTSGVNFFDVVHTQKTRHQILNKKTLNKGTLNAMPSCTKHAVQ